MVPASLPLLQTLYAVADRYGKLYCYPSQEKLLALLERHHGIKRSRRTLNRWLALLEEEGYFRRIRRLKRGADGGLVFQTTLYRLTKKTFRCLRKFGYSVRKLLNFSVCHSWHTNRPSHKQVPTKPPPATPRGETPEENKRRFEEVMAYYRRG